MSARFARTLTTSQENELYAEPDIGHTHYLRGHQPVFKGKKRWAYRRQVCTYLRFVRNQSANTCTIFISHSDNICFPFLSHRTPRRKTIANRTCVALTSGLLSIPMGSISTIKATNESVILATKMDATSCTPLIDVLHPCSPQYSTSRSQLYGLRTARQHRIYE